jgi:hypothetical protein
MMQLVSQLTQVGERGYRQQTSDEFGSGQQQQ